MSKNNDDSDVMRDLIKKRGTIRGKFTLFYKFLEALDVTNLNELSLTELKIRYDKAESLITAFSDIQDEIEYNCPHGQMDKELAEREGFENTYYSTITKAKCILDTKNKYSNKSECTSKSTIRLPTIALPSFDGSYDQWLEFRDTYLSLIHSSSEIDNVQKFHYLRSSLTGNALMVIKSLEFSTENYSIAWELLENRYNNSRLLIQNHLKALFSISSLSKESPVQIRKLIDTVLKNIRALKTLGEPTESWDTLIIYLITTRLDQTTEREWETFKSTILNNQSHSNLTLNDFIKFLKDRADVLETINSTHNKHIITDNNNKKLTSFSNNKSYSHISTHQKHVSAQNKPSTSNNHTKHFRNCTMCSSNHPLYSCNSFLNLSLLDKIKFVNDKDLCRNCLRAGHTVNECWFGPCRLCNQKHNSLIHNDNNGALQASVVSHVLPGGQHSGTNASTATGSAHTHTLHSVLHTAYAPNNATESTFHSLLETVLLSTALVEIADADSNYHTIRALLDNGSQHCLIAESLCKKLNIQMIQSTVQITGVGSSVTNSTQSCEVDLKSKTSDYYTRFRCLVLSQITAQLPSLGIKSRINIPENIQLADPNFDSSLKIELLIGADRFWDLLDDGLIRLSSGPYLQNTKLGWIISGALINNINSRINRVQCNYSQSLDNQLRKFWELEEIPLQNNLTQDEGICEKLFKETTYRDKTGRFCVRVPLRKASDTLGDSYLLAKNRFLALERKLERSSPEFKILYCDFMKEYLDLGHMTRIYDVPLINYFLPHHGVLREHSITTKLRVVFDASAKSTSGESLNDIQFTGPGLQNDILSILLRFRQFKFVACADVQQFFRQILIQPDQRNLQLIIWRDNISEELGVYQLNTVTYGTASAPYLSNRCLKQLALECADDVIKRVIDEDFFVDDLVTGHDNKDTLLDICDKVSKLLKSAHFPLRKWLFNLETSLDNQPKELSLCESILTKTLGLGWISSSDFLHFTTKIIQTETNVTKRVILSTISQIYDPLGLLAPSIVLAKILLQKLWLHKLGWDDPIPSDIVKIWHNFINKLTHLQNIRIPRHVKGLHSKYTNLHIFTDASQDAYGACAYVSTYDDHSPITVRLLCAKTKVAPIKPVTIPRLELCGALIGAKLYNLITKSLRLEFDNVYFWSDSTIVINWIKISPNLLKPFVQNRVVQINELTDGLPWLHVAGKDNPADLLSRGLTLDALQYSDIWWHGPCFLRESKQYSSQSKDENINSNDLPELKSNIITLTSQINKNNLITFERFSDFNRLRRAAAYILRFIYNTRQKMKDKRNLGPLTSDELTKSTLLLVRMSQNTSFPAIYNALKPNSHIKLHRSISSLDVFIDTDHIIRVGGRLRNSKTFSYNKKHPILLCSKHTFTRLLFEYEHKRLLHAGPQLLLATIRDSWWPLRGRDLARQTVHKCITCTRQTGQTLSVKMGDLPVERLESGYPFFRSGVDYAGPMFILNRKGRGAKLEKCYLCLFICFITRAIHLELVTSLSSEAYLMALKRFISRRGKPAYIYSDNGKTFIGALKEFSDCLKLNEVNIQNYTASEGISFKFIPPYSPHFGGLWEAGVKSVKHHIRRAIGNTNLTYEEFYTVLTQIEAILNSRPICPISSDPTDFLPLTPAHFLIGRPLVAPACEDVSQTEISLLSRYKRIEHIRRLFWKRWATEYISEMQHRRKWQEGQESLEPDTLVLIKDDNSPPLMWSLGRIVRTFKGRDGISRVADVRTSSGIIRRSYPKLCPLFRN